MPRLLMEELLPENFYNNLVNDLLQRSESCIFFTVTGIIQQRGYVEDVIPETRPDVSPGYFIHGERNTSLSICPGWIPVYSIDNKYLGFEAGARHYRPVWGDKEDATI